MCGVLPVWKGRSFELARCFRVLEDSLWPCHHPSVSSGLAIFKSPGCRWHKHFFEKWPVTKEWNSLTVAIHFRWHIHPSKKQVNMAWVWGTQNEGRLVKKNWTASSCDLIQWHVVCLYALKAWWSMSYIYSQSCWHWSYLASCRLDGWWMDVEGWVEGESRLMKFFFFSPLLLLLLLLLLILNKRRFFRCQISLIQKACPPGLIHKRWELTDTSDMEKWSEYGSLFVNNWRNTWYIYI